MAPSNMDMIPPPHPEKGSSLVVLCVAGILLCTASVILRFWSRATRPNVIKFGVDDWAALVAWAFILIELLINTVGTRSGFSNIFHLLQKRYGEFYIYNFGIAFVRISALLFYRREFKRTHKTLDYLILSTASFSVIWILAFNFGRTFSCSPIEAFWDRTIPHYHCQPTFDQQWAVAITSGIFDLWVLILPLPYVMRSQAAFMFGFFFVCSAVGFVLSAIVTGAIVEMDLTKNFANPSYWYVCEGTVTLCLASLPCIFDLGRRLNLNGSESVTNDPRHIQSQSLKTREKKNIDGH